MEARRDHCIFWPFELNSGPPEKQYTLLTVDLSSTLTLIFEAGSPIERDSGPYAKH